MSELDPESLAQVNEQYEGIAKVIRDQDPAAELDIVARVLLANLATALVCIEIGHERMDLMEQEIDDLRGEIRMLTGRC